MSISVNGQSCVPPGFRFHPTEEELLTYYLAKKLASQRIDLDVIRDVDLNKLEPWDIQEACKVGSGPQNDWYFFSHKDKKYPTGTRTNRATAAGFWKATGRDKAIYNSFKRIGMRKTLVFYKGRAPHGQTSDWIMHEYRLDDLSSTEAAAAAETKVTSTGAGAMGTVPASEAVQEDGWVVCRVFKKKHRHKDIIHSPSAKHGGRQSKAAAHSLQYSAGEDALVQILHYMGRSCKQEHEVAHRPVPRDLRPIETVFSGGGFMKLPPLESPSASALTPCMASSLGGSYVQDGGVRCVDKDTYATTDVGIGITDWAMMDRLVASHLNGQSEASKQLASCFDSVADGGSPAACISIYSTTAASMKLHGGVECDGNDRVGGGDGSDGDLWSFARSASSGVGHV